ncbi:MAG: DUF1080 domain-containing protein [Myxococcota bacterium]
MEASFDRRGAAPKDVRALVRVLAVSVSVGISASCGDAESHENAPPDEKLFFPLVPDGDSSNLNFFGLSQGQLSVVDGVLTCAAGNIGYWYTADSYQDFELRFDFRFERPQDLVDEEDFAGNSGYLIYMSGPDKLWPASIEVQGMNLEVGRIFAIGGASRVMNEQFIDVRRRVRRPVGEWNELVIHSTGGALEATLNGEVVGRSQPGDMTEGPIGFQCEGARIQWRDIKISTKASL